ncbi:DEAD/DEAH box helicase [Clostridium beijerinckii]|uniref:ATP-dependent RNA helicase DbpA n=2 Tax=Clostridium beijerinckii TaxID=1520 RepID=A0A9Q5CN71_CLOBE|nr:DEAD/DEAH box helicase [Clostridium beijerinckii]AQS05510.1 ATP-dependent RNA helicase DbpA [Clostridium beijerinckii]MBA2884987.1 superfamily II DNA/RNA helicase [Clostridium beijerinckii]MBA2899639.1 superfamily II DNA/RNA helicase [Clostridium beijerinckii]MBA2909338.1 superfamily II DNA/RNA helicase [Clostridium beijerinckii]MBA9014911.1 superfamily II DNA/RNA helicase [Clostridium beijerinckii]
MIKANFNDYKLCNELLKAISMLNFNELTKVQEQVIPIALEEKDIVVKSKTGSGKTASYAIPICQLVDWEENKPQALVITPTRELAIQVKEDFFNIGRFKRIKAAAIYGKSPFYDQEKELKQKTHIVVGTPGRIIDHIEKGTFDTSKIKYLIIDEADEMLNMGFVEQIETIIKSIPKERVTMLLSATMPKDIETLCNKYMKEPIHIEIEEQNKSVDNICQERYNVNESHKIDLLRDITILENPDSCMIFCNTKQKVDEVYKELAKLQYDCRKIHGGMEQSDRLRVMNNFKLGYFRYLIATDVAARGIDIDNITHVINYDIPEDKESYVHRIGRTGRAGRMGRAITFVTQNESKFVNDIHEYIGKEILLKERPKVETVNNFRDEFYLKMNTRPEIKETKGAKLSKEIMKLHINAGKKTKMRAVDIVGTLCNIEGMTKDDIGIINIVDISTFVEILNNKGEWVFQQLQKTPIKGRLRTVSKVDI